MLQKQNSVQFASPRRDVASAPAVPQAQIAEDEAMLRGANAIIGGTVHNISTEKLHGLSIEIELMRRDGTANESRTLEVSPADLAPGETGRYSLSLPTRQWIGARVTTLQSSARDAAVAFKSTPGARRPPERVPQGRLTKAPRTTTRGEEFINTPDNPTTIR